MNTKIAMIVLLILAITGFVAFGPEADPKEKEAVILKSILQVQKQAQRASTRNGQDLFFMI